MLRQETWQQLEQVTQARNPGGPVRPMTVLQITDMLDECEVGTLYEMVLTDTGSSVVLALPRSELIQWRKGGDVFLKAVRGLYAAPDDADVLADCVRWPKRTLPQVLEAQGWQ